MLTMLTDSPPLRSAPVPKVLCLGEMLWDYLADQPGKPYSAVTSWTAYPGGAPANVACGLVKLGIPAAFLGRLGQDPAGKELGALLQTLGVNIDGLQWDSRRPTRLVYVTRTEDGDRQFAGFGAYETEAFADTALEGETLPESLFTQAKYGVLGTIGLAYPDSAEATKRFVTLAHRHHVALFLDLNWRSVFWADKSQAQTMMRALIDQVQILKCTDEEGQWLCQSDDPDEIHRQFPHLQGVLVTAGEKGCAYRLRDFRGQVPAYSVAVRDTTGAGDSFVAGFLAHTLTQGPSPWSTPSATEDAVRYGCAVGALTTLHPGAIAAQPTAPQVKDFLAQQP